MEEKQKADGRELGMEERITRRDYLNSTLAGAGAALMGGAGPLELMGQEDWDGYSGVGDYRGANGNTHAVMTAGHKIRDNAYGAKPEGVMETGETYDCVVVGGGISGLAAALFVGRREGKRTCLVIENHPIFGGEGKRNEFRVDGKTLIAHQGSAMFFPPIAGTFLDEFYPSVGIDWRRLKYQSWGGGGKEMKLSRTPYTQDGPQSAFYFGEKFGVKDGMVMADPWGRQLEGAPIGEQARRELLGMRAKGAGRALPKEHGDAEARRLDGISLEQELMERYGLSRETVRTYLSPVSGGGSGMGADALSAYAEYAADVLFPWQYGEGAQMFPGGNAGVARHIVKALNPEALSGAATMEGIGNAKVNFGALDRAGARCRVRLGATVVAMRHEGEAEKAEAVEIVYAQGGKLYRVRGRSAIVAGGSWTAKHIVTDLPETHRAAYGEFYRAPCLMANVAVRNWRFLYKLGICECQWFEGIGNYLAVRKTAAMGGVAGEITPDSPVVLTWKILFSRPGLAIGEQVSRGRGELYATPYRDYERRIREQMAMMFARSGFDARRDIAGIILNRWGHAYLSAQPGFFFGLEGKPAPGEVLRRGAFGRMAFANSDVTGIMDHRASIMEAKRAVEQVAGAMGG